MPHYSTIGVEEPNQSTWGFAALLAGVAVSALVVGTYAGQAIAGSSLYAAMYNPSVVARFALSYLS